MSRRDEALQRLNTAVSRLEAALEGRAEALQRAAEADEEIRRLVEERNRLAHDNQKLDDLNSQAASQLDASIERLSMLLGDAPEADSAGTDDTGGRPGGARASES